MLAMVGTTNYNSHTSLVAMYNHFEERSGRFFSKTKHTLILRSTIRLLVVYPREIKTYIYKRSCRRMFVAALSIIAPNPEIAQVSVNRNMDTHREMPLNNRKDKLLRHASAWINLKNISPYTVKEA